MKVMKRFLAPTTVALAAALVLMTAGVTPTAEGQGAPTVYAVTSTNALLRFAAATPGTIAATVPVTGLQSGESIVGIDVRPANGQLYGLGSTGRLYTINPSTGAAALAGGAALSPALSGTQFGVDFNPVPDRLRVVSDAEQNLRINVDTAEVTVDGALAYVAGDPNAGQNPSIIGAAYTNNTAGATTTTLYVIDSNRNVLATQNPPNDGVLNTVGPLGLNASQLVGFDIAPGSGTAYAAITPSGGTSSTLHTVDLTTGRVTQVGTIGGGQTIQGLAVALGAAAPAQAPAAKPSGQPAPAAKPAGAPVQAPSALPRTGEAENWAIGGLTLAATVLLGAGLAARRRRI